MQFADIFHEKILQQGGGTTLQMPLTDARDILHLYIWDSMGKSRFTAYFLPGR